MNTNVCFDGHFLWNEFGKEKQNLFKTPNIFCNILLEYYDQIPNLKNVTKAIETGTFQAHSAMCLSKLFDTVDTIELFSENNQYSNESLLKLYESIKPNYKNITFHDGASPIVLKNILQQNKDETYFILLDAHTFNYSPMIHELESIKQNSNKKDHIIMIDDCNFLGRNGYPPAQDLIEAIKNINSNYKIINTFQGNQIILIY